MRCLTRNKQDVYYALFIGMTENHDSEGYFTGERTKKYSDPVYKPMNVSPAKSNATMSAFGIETNYDKVLMTSDTECPIDENSILWIEKDPLNEPHNYEVVRIAKSLNSISFAVREVAVN